MRFLLQTKDDRNQMVANWLDPLKKSVGLETIEETDTFIYCQGKNFRYTYDKRKGTFVQIIYERMGVLTAQWKSIFGVRNGQ